jgi:hypothetical protein
MKRGISDSALKRVARHTPKQAWDEGLHDPGDYLPDDDLGVSHLVFEEIERIKDNMSFDIKTLQTVQNGGYQDSAWMQNELSQIADAWEAEAASLREMVEELKITSSR